MADFESKYTGEEVETQLDKMVGLTDEDGYIYSAGEKVDMRFTRSLLPVGTSIPANANLNTIEYMKIGKYYCSLNADAKTIKNCPVNVAFSMEVFNPLGTNVDDETTRDYTYRMRVITQYDTGQQYMQFCRTNGTAGTWIYESWYVTPRVKFALASSKNDGSAAIGATNKGVYVDSTGEIKAMSYTVAKSVPSNAVFTDTNTKVTAVDNHYAPAEDEAQQIDAPSGEVVTGIKRDAAGHVVGVVTTPQTGGGGGGGGITVETDPVFSASPAASITEGKISSWDGKQDAIADLDAIRSGAEKGATAVQSSSLSAVATSGSYNDLSNKPTIPSEQVNADWNATSGKAQILNKPTIPSAVTESIVSGWGFTKNVGTITEVKMNGVSKGTSGVVDLGDAAAYPIVESSETSVTLSANRMTRITTQVVDSLEIILPEDNGEVTNECIVRFQVDPSSTGAELIVPSNVQWADGSIPAMSAGKTYEISFLNGCATFLEF